MKIEHTVLLSTFFTKYSKSIYLGPELGNTCIEEVLVGLEGVLSSPVPIRLDLVLTLCKLFPLWFKNVLPASANSLH